MLVVVVVIASFFFFWVRCVCEMCVGRSDDKVCFYERLYIACPSSSTKLRWWCGVGRTLHRRLIPPVMGQVKMVNPWENIACLSQSLSDVGRLVGRCNLAC